MKKKLLYLLSVIILSSCAFRASPPAPIIDGIAQFAGPVKGTTVAPPTNNQNENSGQATHITRLTPNETSSSTKIEKKSRQNVIHKHVKSTASSAVAHQANQENNAEDSSVYRDGWTMPVRGGAVGQYNSTQKGVEIKAKTGTPIYAASSGKVVYSGNGLKGYGNLIIIRHDNGYLTAYAQNKVNLVKIGQNVQAGDKIAEIGDGGVLHFELRKNGKPINPADYIDGK